MTALLAVVVAVVVLARPGGLGGGSQTTAASSTGAAGTHAGRSGQTSSSRPRKTGRRDGPRVAAPPAATTRLTQALTRAMSQAGPASGALVLDLGTGSVLYARRAGVARPPASIEKLWTTTALLSRLSPDTRLHTSVLGTGRLRGGVWHGDLYLRGGGDPTFGEPTFNHYYDDDSGATTTALAAQLVARGIRRVTGRLYGDETLFDRRRGGLMTKYLPDVPDFGGQLSALTFDHGTTARGYNPATFAARELALVLRGSHIHVTASRHDGRTPARAHLLATVSSPTLSTMLRLMNVPSDDLFADLFAKQLGVLFGSGGTISAGAEVISDTIASRFGLHPRILDGSGLSRDDRSSPLQIVTLLKALWRTPAGRVLVSSLPVVGRDGTVASIATKTPAAGRCVAKTGSLDDVTNLAGYCAARGRRSLAFAIFADGPENGIAFPLEGRMIAAIARY
ncbi:MAG: D-alanyl-D-alanine carboxypeptidase/D-alanyl-D-alanine-endopeptidase [Solirubrobacteraceae bacterium]